MKVARTADREMEAPIGGANMKRMRQWLLAGVIASVAVGSALIGSAQPAQAAVKGKVICTEREPADAPTHFRFEDGGSQPEVIVDLDYASPLAAPRWEVGKTYLMTVDDNTEQVAPSGTTLFSSSTECTAESKGNFKLSAAAGGVTTSLYLSWETDPVPETSPWSKTTKYVVRISDIGGKTSPPALDGDPSNPSAE